ncbi:jerky protein homolog-like [Trichonephila clavipes]|nr:jerky protein homolog-like [Trichonephila clavipes]
MVCANTSGTHTLPLLMIGKSKKPHYFKNVSCLSTLYKGKKSAWMNSDLFLTGTHSQRQETFVNVKGKQAKFYRFFDNAPYHPPVEILNAIDDDFTLMHLPPNVTALVQLMDQGVIEKLKRIYRKQVLQTSLLAENDEESVVAFAEKLNMKDVCYMIADSHERQGFQESNAEDYGFQILNNDEIVVFVQEESDPVDDETDKDEDNNNESDKAPSNADAFSALETAMVWYEQKSAFLLNYCCSRESETLR